MNWLIGSFNEIVSAVKGVSVKLRDKLEYKTHYTAIDFTADELVTLSVVEALIASGGSSAIIVSIPAGSDIPFLVDMTDPLYGAVQSTCAAQIELLTDGDFASATKSRIVYDVPVEKDFVDDTRAALSQLQVSGYPDDVDPTITQYDLILIIK